MRLRNGIIIALAAAYTAVAASFKPTKEDLLDLNWHRELPLRFMMRGLARLLPRLYERRGEEGVKALQYVFYRVGEDRARILSKELAIDPGDARSLGRVLDYEDGMVGVRGTWTEERRGRAVKEERYCPASRELAECPEVCTCLMMAMEAGTFSVINPELSAPEITKLLSKGDDCCLAVIEVATTDPDSLSPQATPGQFPPVLAVQGLKGRLMFSALRGTVRAVRDLASGRSPEPMHWYEFFRYSPGG